MQRHTFLAVVLAATGSTVLAQDVSEQIKALRKDIDQAQDQLVQERAKLLSTVKVNGRQLDPREVMREAVYLAGGKLVEAKVANFFIVEELKKQIEAGGKRPEDFLVTDEEVTTTLAPMQAEFESKNPGVDFWEVVRSQLGLSKETFLEQRKESMLFDKVFFPGNPKEWPDITKEAIKAQTQSDQGPRFLEQLEKATETADANGQPKKLPEFWMQMMRNFVQKGLRQWSDIRYASHGLPPEVVLQVNDLQWSTEEAFDFIKKGIYVQDLERALQEVVAREALRQELVAKGAWLSDEEFLRRYDEYREPFDSTPFTVEIIATRFKGYPCLEAFRARWRLVASFAEMIKDEINDENLQAHADKYAAFFADGQTAIDLIPFMAKSPKTGAWEPDGMDKARQRCEAMMASLEKGEITFDDALRKHSEFYHNDEKRGRLGLLPLNQVRQNLRESEFTQLHDGVSLAEYLFYQAEVGKTVGPLPGADGYYIARVNSRTPPRKKVDVKNERERQLVREDYVTHRFFEWAEGVISRVKLD
ncbi:MAG: hypothetical protein JNL08_07470 [Planctomycetes bacterium]|nr:hypothetical protein [Planctomycetota bacterium]